MVEPRPELAGEQARALVIGDVGPAAARRQAVEIDEMRAPMRQRLQDAVNRLLEPAAYQRYRAAAASQENRAVFEIPEILERILERG